MWFNNGNNNCSCLWLIIILILIFFCCGNGRDCDFACDCRRNNRDDGCSCC